MSELKRCAIIGTAQSLQMCPWEDATLEIWGLNDTYVLGVPRIDRWFDLHLFHQMVFRQPSEQTVHPDQAPVGSYLRPAGHLEWLRSRPCPVFLTEARPGWPTSQTFPKDAILQAFASAWPYRLTRTKQIMPGTDYETSTPAWMLMQAIVEGYQEVHVYGIHLATEWEYVQQRPNFEWLLGYAAGKGIKIVLPTMTPVCQAAFRYAFEPKSDLRQQAAQRQVDQVKQTGAVLQKRRARLPWYAYGQRRDLEVRLRQFDVDLLDLRQQIMRAQTKTEASQ